MTDSAACRAVLEAARAEPARLDAAARQTLAAAGEAALDTALREFAAAHGAGALPVLTALAEDEAARGLRRAAKRALYRLAQQGVAAAAKPARRPVVERRAERAVRAWMSGIDGTGSRAVWVLFEGGFGGNALASLIVNDTVGILDVAGGEITKRRLEEELKSLRASQKLPWIEVEPARAVAAVAEALALHAELGTSPPTAFARWQPLFESAPPTTARAEGVAGDFERAGELLALPELASWFLEPESVQSDALAVLEARESRLVVSDQIKAEREQAIVSAIVERELVPAVRRRWARRLDEMGFVFDATGRPEPAAIARAAAAALADETRDAARQPFATGLARRSLEIAGEVAAGRLKAADVSRKP
ncbi:MAG TPA: hypothetical protein VGT02_02795 [Methylomirabilota bacterium]|jgi:hypothetical protein|nr:hypothetical protein [Methylomirabilota bacterium]